MKNNEFIIGSVPITKEEVRAISIGKLNLAKANTFVDVGAGTGSISVEVGYNYPNLKILSIEKEDDAVELINKNIEKFKLNNIEIVKNYAPIHLDNFEGFNSEIDSIFIGGTGGNLEKIVSWSNGILKKGGKLVANFIIVDTFNKALELLKIYGFINIDVSIVNVSKLEKLGGGDYFKPLNPIYIISCEKGE